MSRILDNLLNTPLNGNVIGVLIGLHWTAVVVEINIERRCGLASTLSAPYRIDGEADVPQAGQLANMNASALVELARSNRPLLASIGVAAINALLTPDPEFLCDLNAEEVIATQGAGIDILCGSVVFAIDPVVQVIGQGGNFHQVRRAGVRTVTMTQSGYN